MEKGSWKIFSLIFAGLTVISMLISCLNERVAGPTSGTETGNAIVLGTIKDESNTPVADVEVRLYPLDYNPLTDGPLPDSLVAYTDSNGHYVLEQVDTGYYNMEAISLAKQAKAIYPKLEVIKDSVKVPDNTLKPTGTLIVTLPALPGNDSSYLYIPGTAIFISLGPITGTFQVVLDFMPPGEYLQLIYTLASDLENPIVLATNFSILSGEITFLEPNVNWGGNGKVNVRGTIVDESGGPVNLALVKLFPKHYNPLIEATQIGYRILQTDSEGKYQFGEVDSGSYFLEAYGTSSETVAYHSLFEISSSDINLGVDTLKPTGTLIVPMPDAEPNQSAYFYIPNTSYYKEVSQGDISNLQVELPAVPTGNISQILFTKDTNRFNPILIAENINVSKNEVLIVSPYVSWDSSKVITLNTSTSGANIQDNLFGFPLLLRLNKTQLDFSTVRSVGEDIRFAKTNGIALNYQIELWTDSSAIIWVKVDTILANNSDQTFIMYWGKENVKSRSNPYEVFSVERGYAAVWHLSERSGGVLSDALYKNSVADANHGNNRILSDTVEIPHIGNSVYMDYEDHIQVTHVTPILKPDSTVMISAWVNYSTTGILNNEVLSMGDDYMLRVNSNGAVVIYNYDLPSTPGPDNLTAGNGINDNAWHYIVGLVTKGSYKIYIDGVLAGTGPGKSGIQYDLNTNLTIGIHGNKKENFNYKGFLDEVRVSGVERTSDWIKLCYENQKKGSIVVQIGSL